MLGLAAEGPPRRPARLEPVTARLVEPQPPELPRTAATPASLPTEPPRERGVALLPTAREAAARPATATSPTRFATEESAASPAQAASRAAAEPSASPTPSENDLRAQPGTTPAAPASVALAGAEAPASAPAGPAATVSASTPALGPSGSAPGLATIAAPGGSAAAAAAASEATRRVGPRVDASWVGNAAPPYPAVARRLGEQGEVRLDVQVAADGAVLQVQVRVSSGSPALDRSAIDTVKRWRFRPATVDGQAVSEWYRDWKWVFRLEG